MVSGWESKGLEFEPQCCQATFDPGLAKIAKYSQPCNVALIIDFARRTLKDFKKALDQEY